MCSPSFTAITSGRDSVQQARQLQCRLVGLNVTCRARAIPPLLGDKRTLPGHRNSVARDLLRKCRVHRSSRGNCSFLREGEEEKSNPGLPPTITITRVHECRWTVSVRATWGARWYPRLASVLQGSWESANTHARSGAIRGIPA